MIAERELYLLPGDGPEDIKQDQELGRLTGRKVSMKRLMGEKSVGYGLHPGDDAIPIWAMVSRPAFEALEKLSGFILEQEEGIRKEILDYLAEPDDGRLKAVVKALGLDDFEVIKAPITLTDLILKALPATLDDLYSMARGIHKSRKPEAAVRQNIRNLVKQRRVEWRGEQLWSVSGSAIATDGS